MTYIKKEKFESIQQCEAAKDVIWFLEGAIASNEYFPLGTSHIQAIRDLVDYVYEKEKRSNK